MSQLPSLPTGVVFQGLTTAFVCYGTFCVGEVIGRRQLIGLTLSSVQGVGCRVWGVACRVQGVGCRMQSPFLKQMILITPLGGIIGGECGVLLLRDLLRWRGYRQAPVDRCNPSPLP